jgi:hypothetical protein
MPTLDYFIICESAAIDVNYNRISFFHVIERELGLQSLPYVLPLITAVSAWIPTPGDNDQDFQAKLRICTPGKIEPGEFLKNFVPDPSRTRLLQRVHNVRIEQAGVMKFEIFLNDTLKGTHEVVVSLTT